ncbi:MAG TPA: penicillin-binding transpeptidase domain-containing protein [Candidatus Angelobacter sp.]
MPVSPKFLFTVLLIASPLGEFDILRFIPVHFLKSIFPVFLLIFVLCGGAAPPPPQRVQNRPASQESTPLTALQIEVNRLMANKAGSVVVMDVASGRILAQRHLDLAGQRLEPPGSTVKPFVLMELLSSGKINAEQRVMCRRPLYIGGKRMDCSHPASITTLDARDAVAYSCNTYFSTVATRLDPTQLAEMYRRTGFTSPTGHTSGEISGRISTAKEPYQLQLQALGEWGIEVTPLELLAAYQNLARQKLKGDSENPGSAAPVFDGLERAVKYGVAHAAQPAGTTAAGKTGTASGVKTPQSHGFFVGYAPADKPQIVVLVYLEHGRGMDAAAVAGTVITAWWKSR